jgi:hypothetical protein
MKTRYSNFPKTDVVLSEMDRKPKLQVVQNPSLCNGKPLKQIINIIHGPFPFYRFLSMDLSYFQGNLELFFKTLYRQKRKIGKVEYTA